MTLVKDLQPGDIVDHPMRSATFVMAVPHPLYEGFAMVAWRLDDGSVTFDALSPLQDVGVARLQLPGDRLASLRKAVQQ